MLFRYLRLWYCLYIRTSNTEAHADMYAHIHTLIVRMEIDIHIPRTSKCCNVLDVREFTRFQVAKHKALMTPLLCLVIAPPKRHNPKAWANYAAKLVNYFGLSKKIRLFLLFCRVIFVYIKEKVYFCSRK